MSQPAYYHPDSGTIRFWVMVDDALIGASVRKEILHHCFTPTSRDEDPLQTYTAHMRSLEAAVRKRVASGSIEPVMLREFDLRQASA